MAFVGGEKAPLQAWILEGSRVMQDNKGISIPTQGFNIPKQDQCDTFSSVNFQSSSLIFSQPQRILLQTSQRDLIGWFTWGCPLISCLFGLFYHYNI